MGAAWELLRQGANHITLVDQNETVGGLARTFQFRGYYFDVGPHRFMTKYKEVEDLWKEVLGEDLLRRPRLTRILYQGRFYDYPLKAWDTLRNLGFSDSILAGLSFLKAKLAWRNREPKNFAEWTIKAFGNRMSNAFFRTYLKKVWGIEAHEVGLDWANQRIKTMSLFDFVKSKVSELIWHRKTENIGQSFYYPKYGAGMFYEAMQKKLEQQGVRFLMNRRVTKIHNRQGTITELTLQNGDHLETLAGDIYISSIPSNILIHSLTDPPANDILRKTTAMRFRAHVAVNMIVNRKDLLPDSWLYIQSDDVKVARIGNYNAFSPFMLADPDTSAIGVEYFCFADDDFWKRSDQDIVDLAVDELCRLQFIRREEFVDAFVVRHRYAYPTYYLGYREQFSDLMKFLQTFDNLFPIGRAGMYKYKDQDHALYTGMLTVRNIFGASHDVWALGEEQEHFEEQIKKR